MNKTELINEAYALCDKTLTPRQIKIAIDCLETVIYNCLKGGISGISLGKIGRLRLVDRAPRTCRNPHTGEAISLPARRTVKLSPSKALKEALNQE